MCFGCPRSGRYSSGTESSFALLRQAALNYCRSLLFCSVAYAPLCLIFLGIVRWRRTHNPLVLGSTPRGPTRSRKPPIRKGRRFSFGRSERKGDSLAEAGDKGEQSRRRDDGDRSPHRLSWVIRLQRPQLCRLGGNSETLIVGVCGFARITSVASRVACSPLPALSKPVHPHPSTLICSKRNACAWVEVRGIEPLSRTPPGCRNYNHERYGTQTDVCVKPPSLSLAAGVVSTAVPSRGKGRPGRGHPRGRSAATLRGSPGLGRIGDSGDNVGLPIQRTVCNEAC